MISLQDYNIHIGEMKHGRKNQITDVEGVRVGHCTLDKDDIHTGVTVILPTPEPVYDKKPVAASYVLNGFGKTAGLIQIDELGVLESPIALTNTLCVGRILDGLCAWTIEAEARKGHTISTFNAVVGETNDSRMNAITKRAAGEAELRSAIAHASEDFAQGSVGAGRGTICFGLKGGIGSSSRLIPFEGKQYTLGILVQSNFGTLRDLSINEKPIGRKINEQLHMKETDDKGSIMVVLATDLPLTARQLKRVLKRCAIGLIRCGSVMGHGSGDVFIGFTTANCLSSDHLIQPIYALPEDSLDAAFRAAGEAVQEAVLSSLLNAEPDIDLNGMPVHALREFAGFLSSAADPV